MLRAIVRRAVPATLRRPAGRIATRARQAAREGWLRLMHRSRHECPVCRYRGPFLTHRSTTGRRPHAACPRCGALERHRLQHCVLDRYLPERGRAILHVAPEDFMRRRLAERFDRYVTCDLVAPRVDCRTDLRRLPFGDAAFDMVFASHVLEHIDDDRRAIAEIHRVLRPGGHAVLPVPIVVDRTVDYPHPVEAEAGHVRAPGLDYFDRYREVFSRVEVLTSESFPERYQPFVYEDRSGVPNERMPYRTPMHGDRHVDAVPVCVR